MDEYGGYIELETFRGELLHEKAIALNCGRSALAYLCEAKHIQKLYLPYFLCSSVAALCERMGIEVEKYSVSRDFLPILPNECSIGGVYVVNFYGQLNNSYIRRLKAQCGHLIIDNAQAYFQMPVEGVDTLYTCRKYFGVADGAFLYTDTMLPRSLERDESYERMHFLLGRYERSANEFYAEYVANNEFFAGEPVKQMSKLTQNLLRAVDYEAVGERRKENFTYLYETLADINELHVTVPYGAFMYPLLLQDGMRIRKELQQRKIYIPTLWPNVLDECAPDSLAYHMAANILPIPVDQRYDFNDMKYLGEMIRHVSTERT